MSISIRWFTFVAGLTLALAYGAGESAQVVGLSITIAPPVLPVYVQPPVPAPGYIWTPGYWAYADGDYYWVPGTWVQPPQVGMLWTPGYWAASGGGFVWNAGYWAPEIGFYGGVNYGFGYVGVGFEGGHWDNGQFFYNRAVTNVSDTHITNVYNKTVVNNVAVNNVSYNGGKGGTTAQPTAHELAVSHQSHVAPTPAQVEHQHAASTNRQLFASVNHGKPALAATQKPGLFSGSGVVAARGTAQVAPTEQRPAAKPTPAPERSNARTEPAPTARVVSPRPSEAGKQTDRAVNHPTTAREERSHVERDRSVQRQPEAARTERPVKQPAPEPAHSARPTALPQPNAARAEPAKKERKEERPQG